MPLKSGKWPLRPAASMRGPLILEPILSITCDSRWQINQGKSRTSLEGRLPLSLCCFGILRVRPFSLGFNISLSKVSLAAPFLGCLHNNFAEIGKTFDHTL